MALNGAAWRGIGAALLAASGVPAQAALYKYVDPVTHVASYTNFRPAQAGARVLAPRPDPPLARPRATLARAGAAGAVARPALLGPAAFPRIDPARQRALDGDRKHIIATELELVQAELARLLAGRAGLDRIARQRGDVAALRRDLARLDDG